MIVRFQDGVEHIAPFDQMTTPATIADVNSGASAVID